MKPRLLLIPGFGEPATDAPYPTLRKKLEHKFQVSIHTPRWSYATASMWLRDLEKSLNAFETAHVTVVSFSLGAYITLLASEAHPFKKIILCSLSPFFKEQMPKMPKGARVFFGKRRVLDFSTHSIPKTIKSPAIFLFGSEDWDMGIEEARKLSKKYGGTFDIIEGAHHELTPEYIEKIVTFVER